MISKHRIITGIKPTGTPHLGNYAGAIEPALSLLESAPTLKPLYFIADLHALTTHPSPNELETSIYEVTATWLAAGLDPSKVTLYLQSAIPESTQIASILACHTRKGAMNIAHAYKAAVDKNINEGQKDTDSGINMGLFNYPILMASDVLSFEGTLVPVGKDQVQHIEIMRDIASRFNHLHGAFFTLPEALIHKHQAVLPGIDGRKMSKSYNNTIPLFASEAQLKKRISQIKTDSIPPGEPKEPDTSPIFLIYQAFATSEEAIWFRQRFLEGISWKDAKDILFDLLNQKLAAKRDLYTQLIQDRPLLRKVLVEGALEARPIAINTLEKLKQTIGLISL
jgi:tryptophanyl-tRNA synthetase